MGRNFLQEIAKELVLFRPTTIYYYLDLHQERKPYLDKLVRTLVQW